MSGIVPPDAAKGVATMKSTICAVAAAGLLQAALPALAQAQSWDLLHREIWLQDRIDHGRKDGSLESAEALRAQNVLDKITHDERFDARTNNGQLSPKDRATIEARLDDLSDHMHWAKANEVHRPW
jgi:hypothetical protein